MADIETGRRLMVWLSSSMISFAIVGAFLSAIYYSHLFVLARLMIAGRKVPEDLTSRQVVPDSETTPTDMALTPNQDVR